jgi:hypothetical protein
MRSRLTYSHTTLAVIGHTVESGAAIVGEVLFTSPDLLHVIGAARPTIGGSVNTDGKTDYIYFDMTWTATVWRPTLREGEGVYLGGAMQDGRLVDGEMNGNKNLGTRALQLVRLCRGFLLSPCVKYFTPVNVPAPQLQRRTMLSLGESRKS